MNKRDKYEKDKIKKRKEKEKEIEKEKEKKRVAYLKEKEEEIRNRIVNIDYKKKKEKKKKEEEEEEEEQEEENDNEYEEIEEEEEERPKRRKEKNRNLEKDKYDKHIENNYLGHKGITKRTIGIGRLNVKVYENDEDDSWLEDVVKKEKKEKREYKKTEITQNKNAEDKYVKNNEINNNNNNNNFSNHNNYNHNNYNNQNINHNNNNNNHDNYNYNNYHNSEGKDSIIFNIDGRNFLIKASYTYSNSSEEGKVINVKFSTTSPGSKIVHWGLYKSISPKIWILPPKSSYPNFTKEVNNKALETKFPNSQVNGQREISFVLPRKLDDGYIGGIYFAIYDPIKNLWYNNFKKNFNLVFK